MRGSTTHMARRAAAVLLVAGLALGATAATAGAGDGSAIQVKKPWARTSPMEASNGAVYMTLKNSSASDQALVAASVPASVAADAQIHETVMGGGMGTSSTTAGGMTGTMSMREVEEIAIPAKSTVKLEPGGYHIMLMELAVPLKTGATVKVTLEFEDGSTRTVKAVVKK